MGLDITTEDGLTKYLKHFIHIFNAEKAVGKDANKLVEQQAKARLKEGTPYISFIAGGNIVFGQAGIVAYKKGNENISSFFINPNSFATNGIALGTLRKGIMVRETIDGQERNVKYNDRLGWYENNIYFDGLAENKPVAMIGEDLSVTTGKPYKDYVMEKVETNIRSVNIGTEQKPNWVTNIQPIITYELKSKLNASQPSNQQIKESISPVIEKTNEPDSSVKDKLAEIKARAKKLLGDNIKKQDEEFLAPEVLGDRQRESITRDIIRVAGLTPDQQFDIVDFIYNQIVPLVEKNNGVVSRSEVSKEVDKTINEVFTSLKKDYHTEIKEAEDFLVENSTLPQSDLTDIQDIVEGFKARITKINSIIKGLPELKAATQLRIEKYTGIKEGKIEASELESEDLEETTDTEVPEEMENNNRDFWTDVLQENPDHRLSYTMRRFFGQIGKYDNKGNSITGYLGLPAYTGADIVTRHLMTLLADVPSDFNTMIAKLESHKEAVPWMQEVIDKLKAGTEQQKLQFVTVMSNTALRMKFTMISYNQKNKTWSTRVYDTHLNGIADSVKKEWKANLLDTNLVIPNADGSYMVNISEAKSLIHEFESWVGANIKKLEGDTTVLDSIRTDVKASKPVIFSLGDNGKAITQFLKANLVTGSDRVKVGMKGYEYQITSVGNGKFKMEYSPKHTLTNDEAGKKKVDTWLRAFGITLSDKTIDDLFRDGLVHNYTQNSFPALFQTGETNGLFGILYNRLKYFVDKGESILDEEGTSPLQDSVISSLATLESKYNTSNVPFGFRDNGKSYFALSIPKFITDRARALKDRNSDIREQLQNISFSKQSLWLRLLEDPEFAAKFQISHIGGNAFKEQGKKIFKENGISNLSEVDHELTKLGMFWDMNQGLVSYNITNAQGNVETFKNYPGTSIPMRIATMFSPTMSDKHMMTVVTTAILNLSSKDLNEGQEINKDVVRALYDQTVKPELQRMIKFYQNGGSTNISNYDKGAGLFLLMPELNNVEYTPGLKLKDAIAKRPFDFTQDKLESNSELMELINNTIKGYINTLTIEKLDAWKESDLVTQTTGEDNSVTTELKFFDKKYMDKFSGNTNEEKAKMAAMDFVINNAIALANSYMTMAGDPALYYKSNSIDSIQQAKDTFVNAGKRLANQIAPGTALANSANEKYIQFFLSDRKSLSEVPYLKFTTKINDGNEITDKEIAELQNYYDNPNESTKAVFDSIAKKYPISSGYFSIEGSDAQEYTTWKEHLDILTKLGKTPDNLSEITADEISEARELFASGVDKKKLTDKQLALIGKVMQPIKPVYTGQLYDPAQDVMRTIYIKSSSFPLIPQLTTGFEIDKLRIQMEEVEKRHKLNVRASYQSANKVGAINSPVKIWNSNGTLDEGALLHMDFNPDEVNSPALILNRENFRIQQEVPFKSAKTGDDTISVGTQLMKLLFGDEIMKYDGFELNGAKYTGKALHEKYNNTFINLVKEKKLQLFDELGLDEQGVPIDTKKTISKLQNILKEEAIKRGYPLQDINGLKLIEIKDAAGEVIGSEFNLPLWASSNSNRYESMLNSIIANRLIKMKFPGNSFVVGSEEGFKMQENFEGVDKSKIIFTSAWNDSNLQGAYYDNGKVKKAQVLIGSKFKDSEGNLIDLFIKENGEYKYITKTEKWRLKEDMFDSDLLTMLSFRIPTSGHQSASQIEIVGFLSYENADLMIVPRNFTKQKGLDFDVDKENSYQLWNYITGEGKFQVLNESHRSEILARADKELQRVLEGKIPEDRMLKAIFGGESGDYTPEQIKESKFLIKLNSKISEKIMQNEIIKINHSVFSNPNAEIQSKINKTLNTNFAEQQADFIEEITEQKTKESKANIQNLPVEQIKDYWTPLSDEYQKQKMIMGASGKIGTGAYSLDLVFHSLVQQSAMNEKPLTLVTYTDEGSEPKIWRFGNIESDGRLGNARTLDGGRSISEVMSERQNIAVDNEKLQVMGRVNLNDITMDVDKVMNILGFDKGEDGNSISFLFLSQPIIKDFVKRIKNANSNVADYDKDKEANIVNALIREYNPDADTEVVDEEYWKIMSKQMTNKNFINSLKSARPDGVLQAAIMRRFIEMKKFGLSIRSIQTTINTDSKGLGKSFFDVIEKRNALNKLGTSQNITDDNGNVVAGISGVTDLIGDYIAVDSVDAAEEGRLATLGYVNIGQFLVLPTTLSGGFNIHGVSTAYNLWNKHFPYDSTMVEKVFDEILGVIASTNLSERKAVEFKQKIFQGIKKYASINKTGIVSISDNLNEERNRIYIDSETNTSLAKYIKTLLQMTNNKVVDTFIKRNNLINRFEFDIQKNGQPSLIKFNNAAGEEFDEQYLYESISTLIEIRGKEGSIELPQVGNKKYTLDTLAQDLIAYSYLGNATQEAIQFTKYVPVSYLNVIGYSELMRETSKWFNSNPATLGIRNLQDNVPSELKHLVGEFTMQFIQHNPERVNYKLDSKSFAKRTIKIDNNSFHLKGDDKPTFISVYDTSKAKGEKKFNLYWFDGSKYTKIPVLGTFGMDEYQPGEGIGTSLVNDRVKVKANPQPVIKETIPEQDSATSLFNIDSKNIYKIVESIAGNNTSKFSKLAEALLPYAVDTIKIDIQDIPGIRGRYLREDNTILINTSIIGDADKLAETVLHEMVHALTVSAIKPHIIDGLGDNVSVSPNAPAYVSGLVRLFNSLKSGIDSGKLEELNIKLKSGKPLGEEFKSNYYGYKNIYEFVAMALTDKGFQDILNNIPYKETGNSFLDKFKNIIVEILESLGVKFKAGFSAAEAISLIFEVVDKSNFKVTENPYDFLTDTEEDNFFRGLDEDKDPDMQLSPSTKEDILIEQAKTIMNRVLPDFLKESYLSDVKTGLKEIAAQLNSPDNRINAESLYGGELSKIALELYPNEKVSTKAVSDFINTIDSKNINC
jgi:hypothetical protein